MSSVRISADHRVTIPKSVRDAAGLQPGQELVVSLRDGIICMLPVPSLDELRGIASDASRHDLREKEDRV